MDFWGTLEPLLKTFWLIALPVSLIFIIQTIMTFIGADGGDGIEPDFNSNFDGSDAPFQLFSLRNLINFLLGFSWAGISFYSSISNKAWLISLSLIVGLLFIYIFFLIIRQMQRLAEDNSFKLSSTLNKTGEVYTPIPERKTGKGKIIISIKGAYHELDAMTEQDKIPSNTLVKVVRIENDSVLIVENI